MFTEIRHAFRALKSSPSVVIVVTLCLALGLGANTTIFALTNAVFLRPLPVQAPHKLVRIHSGWGGERFRSSSYPEYSALNERRDAFQGVAAYSRVRVSVGRAEETSMEHAILATGNFFQVVGLIPAAGRFFTVDEDRVAGEHMVAVISHQLWTQRFGGSNDVIGKSVYVNGQPFRVVGVAPANFFGMEPENESALWLPIMSYPVTTGRDQTQLQQGSHWLTLIGRLAPGVTIDRARQVATAVARANSFGFESTASTSLQFTVLKGGTLANTEESAEIGIVFLILNVVVGLVLLIACANVANVLLARALDRRREVAIRLSLGAGRLRIMRQLLTEALLLGLIGGAAGLALAFWGARLLQGFRLPAGIDPTPDLRVFAYSFVVALATALLFGILPARQSARASVSDALKQGKRLGNPTRSRLRSTLVVAQLSLSVLLLVMAGLLLRALQELRAAQTGVVEARMVSGDLDLTTLGVGEEQGKLIFDRILEQVRALPDVEAASMSAMLPSGARQWRTGGVTLPEHQQFGKEEIALTYNVVGPEYFKALGIPLLRGRDLTSGDRKGQPRAFVVNQAFVRRYWPDRAALGTRIQMSADEQGQIVGVVGDVRYESAGEAAEPTVFMTYQQNYQPNLALQVRARGDERAIIGELRRTLQAVHPGLAAEFHTFAEIRRSSEFGSHTVATLLSVFGAIALLLATIGLYGVVAYVVAQRTHEIGVRVALGARPLRVVQLVVSQGLRHTIIGLGIGSVLAVTAGKLLSGALFGVRAFDAQILAGVSAIMVGVALIATVWPAQRAASVDPVVALRSE